MLSLNDFCTVSSPKSKVQQAESLDKQSRMDKINGSGADCGANVSLKSSQDPNRLKSFLHQSGDLQPKRATLKGYTGMSLHVRGVRLHIERLISNHDMSGLNVCFIIPFGLLILLCVLILFLFI